MQSRKHIMIRLKSFIVCAAAFLLFLGIMASIKPSLTAYATEQPITSEEGNGSGTEHPGELNEHDNEGYPSTAKTGWLVYLRTTDGQTPFAPTLVPTGSLSGTMALTTKFGDACTAIKNILIDRPFTTTGSPQGELVKDTLLTEGSPYYWTKVIKALWGLDVLETVKEQPSKYYLCLEVVTCHSVNPGPSYGTIYTATVTTWPSLHTSEGMDDGKIGWCDNSVAPDSGYLVTQWPGLPAPPTEHALSKYYGRLSDSLVGDKNLGYGMIAIRLKDDCIHTYDSKYGSPGKEEDAQPNKIGHYNMVKVYYTKYMKNGSLLREEQDGSPYVELNCVPQISIDEEPNEWHLEHWSSNSDLNTSIDYKSVRSMNGPQHGEGAKIITLSPERNEKTVYVVLVRIKNEGEEETDYNYLMTQSMISRAVWFSFPDNKLDMAMIYENEFTWKSPAHPEECEGHSCEHTKEEEYTDETGQTKTREVDDTQEGNCTEPKWEEHKINFSLYNTKKTNFPSIVATRSDFEGVEIEMDKPNAQKRYEPKDNWGRTERPDDEMLVESIYETTAKKPWDYICVLMRGADKLTVAQTANAGGWIVNATAANEELANVSSEAFAIADTKQGMRKTDDYYEHFDNYFDKDPEGDYQTTVKYTKQWECPRCNTEFGICYDTEEYTLSTPLSVNNVKVKIETYSGNPNGGWENTDLDDSAKIVKSSGLPGWADNTVNTHSGRMVNSQNKISFLPYVLMKYQTRESGWAGWHDTLNNKTAGWKKAYVLGQYTRSINPNDYAEIHWDEKDQPNMSLLSNQWSTHALATNCWGTNNVLPGGATLGLKIKTSDRQEVYVTTLQCYTDGYGREQCEKTGGDPGSITREDCVSTHSEFVHSVANSLDNTNVQQWQSDEVHDEYAWDDGQKVNRGESLDGLNTSGKRSSDDLKYYFGDLREGSNRGDYDVNIESTVTHTYTFYSDVNGAIHMTIDNTSPSEYEDDGAYSAIANAINERTLVRDKLIDAVEQSVNGDDTNKNDKDCFDDKALNGSEWYNEEFDGITVIVQETKITTGFLDPAERTEVLDPKLTQEQKSKGKQFGMEYDNKAQQQGTYELGQFKTRNYSENWGPDNPEIMAVFKGSTVAMHNLEYFYWTRRFWIPNLTVQDLY